MIMRMYNCFTSVLIEHDKTKQIKAEKKHFLRVTVYRKKKKHGTVFT